MKKQKRQKLEAKGWRVGTVDEFLDLSPEDSAYIELKLKLSESLRARRRRKRLSQVALAKLVKSSQSRVAKMESGDPSVSVDLLIRSHIALGVSRRELGKIISGSPRSTAA